MPAARPSRPALIVTFIKPVVHGACLVPLLWLGWLVFTDDLGANPIEALVRTLGDWSLRMLLVALAVTPLRQLTGWGVIGRVRRMLGLYAFAYVALHVAAYVALDQGLDWPIILSEIIKRKFILVGMAGFLILIALALTSPIAAVRYLGGARWQALHRLVYAAGILGVVHHYMMVKADTGPPLQHAALLALLLGWRLMVLWQQHRESLSERAE